MFSFNGREFRFEVEDYDDLSRYQEALEQLGQEEAELNRAQIKDGFTPIFIRNYCQMIYRFFNKVLGEGAADSMFDGKMHMGLCEEAYVSFLEYTQQAAKDAAKERTERRERLKRYLPGYKSEE